MALLLGVVALLVQLAGWAGMPMRAMAAAADPEICSAHDDAPPHDTADHHTRGCPLCTLVHGLSGPPPADTLGIPVSYVVYRPRPLAVERVATGWFLSSLQPRAPPAAA